MIDRIAIAGYRSLRSLVIPLGQLTIVSGANGSGKSNVYRSLRLLASIAEGGLIRSLAQEGGFGSVRWAGPEKISEAMRQGLVPVQGTVRREPVSLRLGIAQSQFCYSVDLGLPVPIGSAFDLDPEIKRECLWRGACQTTASLCADRRRGLLRVRGSSGKWQDVDLRPDNKLSMVSEYVDPYQAPELLLMREFLRGWRFYDTFRVDHGSPARRPAMATYTPVMADDGHDLAAAIQTILEVGDRDGFCACVADAFPSTQISVQGEAELQVHLQQAGMLRSLSAAELSDGTLRFLLLATALLTPRPPALMVLNEPENSLHPDLIPALGRLIELAAENSQLVVVTHSIALRERLQGNHDCETLCLEKQLGETVLRDANLLDAYRWKWPTR